MYDLLLKGGRVIDPAQGISTEKDVTLTSGKIAAIEDSINPVDAKKTIPLAGKLVVPGLIDIHCHASSPDSGKLATTDYEGINSGVCLICDAGSAGAANFDEMVKFTVNSSHTDMFCFINLATTGLLKTPEIWSEHDIDPAKTAQVITEHRELIKGVKIRAVESLTEKLGVKAIELAKKLADDFNLPLMVHIGEPRPLKTNDTMDSFTREAIKLMDKGDILSHYVTWGAGGLIKNNGMIYPEILEARKRGVLMDCCEGLNNFSFKVARQALAKNVPPDLISTDLGEVSVPVVQSLLVVMSKYLNLGLTLEQVIAAVTINPARALSEETNWGSLTIGTNANISVLELATSDYLFSDGTGKGSLKGDKLLEPYLVIKDGREIPCCSRYQIPPIYT